MAELGQRYRDTVTGYQGVATARAEYLQENSSIRLTCISKDGRPEDTWFAEGRLEPVADTSTGFSQTVD